MLDLDQELKRDERDKIEDSEDYCLDQEEHWFVLFSLLHILHDFKIFILFCNAVLTIIFDICVST